MQDSNKISFGSAVLMSINIIVGAGIFIATQVMTSVAGSTSFLGWLLVGMLLFPIIWSVAQASRIFPGEGGFYNYCATGINPTAGFAAQWVYLLAYMGTAATITTYLRDGCITRCGLTAIADHPYLFNAVVITFFSLLNLLPISLISRVQGVATFLKLIPLFFVILVFGFYWDPTITYSTGSISTLALTIPGAIFSFWGFEACCSFGHLLKDGPQQVGKIILTAFFSTVALYTVFHFGLIQIMGVDALATQGTLSFPAFMGLSSTMTAFLSSAIVGSILLSYSNSIFGVSLANITNLTTIARKKLVVGLDALTATNSNGQPTIAVLVHGILIWLLLVCISSGQVLMALVGLGVCFTLTLTLVALLLTYMKRKNYAQLVVTLVAFASCAMLIYQCWFSISDDGMVRIMSSLPLLGGLILGLVLYKLQQMKTRA